MANNKKVYKTLLSIAQLKYPIPVGGIHEINKYIILILLKKMTPRSLKLVE